MTALTIGGRQLAVTRPANLDEQLVTSTGCSAAELADILRRVPTSFAVARAMRPLLDDADAQALSGTALNDLIDTDQLNLVALQVAALLAPPVAGALENAHA